ncbi:MAG: hypothetical protein L6R30_22075 [Thermoanaerobaculia bacterium]|nr:hypothetical protein [Thermoanaerobaculia bacterium]
MFEIVSFWVVVLSAVPFVFQYMRAMATTSLWNDEIYTILNHSGKGPVSVLTDYSSNNHLLVNLVNSLLLAKGSLDPLRARFVSVLSVLLLLSGTLWFFYRRGALILGGGVFLAVATNREILDLFLQARGYGLAGLFALVVSASFLEFRATRNVAGLIGLCAGTVFGCLSLPTFAFWAVPVWLVLLATDRSSRVAIALLASALGVMASHAGVLAQMLSLQMRGGYAAQLGYQYSSVASVFDTLRLYVFGALGVRSDWFIALLLLGFLSLLAIVVRQGEAAGSSLELFLSALLFFVLCLALRTPIVRTTSFIAVPFLVSAASLLEPLLGSRNAPVLRPLLALGLAGVALVFGAVKASAFEFVPIETWRETAGWIGRIFPRDVRVHVTQAPPYMRPYLDPIPVEPALDRASFLSGTLVLADTPMLPDGRRRVQGEEDPRVAELKVIQRRNGFQRILFAVPPGLCLAGPAGLGDRDVRTCAVRGPGEVKLSGAGSEGVKTLAVAHTAGLPPEAVEIAGRSGLIAVEWSLHQDGLSLYGLGDQEIESATIRMPPGSCLAEVWAYPVAFKPGP